MQDRSCPDLALLAASRVHEASGAGRWAFALALAARLQDAVLWVQDTRTGEQLYPPGIVALIDPARIVLARPTGALEVLQVMEEALRSGAAPLVVAELREAPDLTQSRRLQLAAGTGGGRGLCLIPEAGLRSNACETRWMCSQLPGSDAMHQHWELAKNKKGRLGHWRVSMDAARGQFVQASGEAALA